MSNPLLALLLTACTGPANNTGSGNPGNDVDADTDAGYDADTEIVYDVMMAAGVNYATWNEDKTDLVDDIRTIEGASYSIPKKNLSGTTTGFVDLEADEYDVDFTFTGEAGASYIGQVKCTVALTDVNPTCEVSLCVDVTGTWDTWWLDENGEKDGSSGYDEIAVDGSCDVQGEAMDENIKVDGHKFGGKQSHGPISEDGNTIELYQRGGYRFVAERR